MKLNVLHLNTWDNVGGAGRAAYRLHTGLKRIGVESRLLVGHKSLVNSEIGSLSNSGLWNKISFITGCQYLFYPSSVQFLNHPWVLASNIVNVHNTHGGYFSHTALPWLSRKRAVVWTLHDMWAFTGHCGYSYDCLRWLSGCGACPYLGEYPRLVFDTTRLLWQVKKWAYSKTSLTLVTPSHWLAELVRASPLLGQFPTHIIANGLDLAVFRRSQKGLLRAELSLPMDIPIVFWGIEDGQDFRKGIDFRNQAVELWKSRGNKIIVLEIEGNREGCRSEGSVIFMSRPKTSDESRIADYYSLADLFVLSSRADNLPNTVIESLACGTPVVAFDVGGISDAVRHLETGYLAQPANLGDLVNGIELLSTDTKLRERLGESARFRAEAEFDSRRQSWKYAELYESLVQEATPSG